MTRLDTLLEENKPPSWRPIARAIMLLLIGLVVWSYYAKLDEVAVATGEVVPQGKIKVIQHLEGGIIEAIHVNEGDTVKEGQPLVQLDLATSGVNKKELQVRLDAQYLIKARLEAETKGAASIIFPKEQAERLPDQAFAERRTFMARKRQLDSGLSVLKQLVRQRELEVLELEARLRAVGRNLKLAKERFKMSSSLLIDGLTPKIEHSKVEAEVESLDGELNSLTPSIPRAKAAVEEALARQAEDEIRFRREAEEELGKTEQNIARVSELLASATEQGIRAEVKSPINGIVKNMRYNTIGGIVQPGEAIMEIVPTGEKLVVEVKLNPTDRGYVEEGQAATVKVSTYDFIRYGGLDGKVILVAPDSSTDESGVPFFRVIVQTDKTYIGDVEGLLPILPGMQATVDIHTGSKSVMDYLIKPVLKLRHEAFRER